jgi:hypothetical protein
MNEYKNFVFLFPPPTEKKKIPQEWNPFKNDFRLKSGGKTFYC